ncbi:MAG: extracellular solute-binding protein [Acidimicrobiales bacterium]
MRRFRSVKVAAAVGILALVGAACGSSTPKASTPTTAKSSGPVTLTLTADAVVGGKNAAEATWLTTQVIPAFEKQMKAQGRDVTVNFQGQGVSGQDYANRLALDLKAGSGPDVFDLDGPYYGEFVQAGYLKPLSTVVGSAATSWSGWAQIPTSVQAITQFKGVQYGIPTGTDGRVLYYNKQLFAKAGLPTTWKPTSWADVLSAARQLKAKDPGIEALQIDAGAQMGEATTLQGYLPFLAGAGQLIYDATSGKWQGNTPAMQATANFFHTVYSEGLGNAQLQLGANGRDQTFQLFSQGKVGIYLESTYMWESVISPKPTALYPMSNRDQAVGYTLIPAESPGKGVRGQNFVSMSGGGGQTLNPHTPHPNTAWRLLTFINSKTSLLQYEAAKPFISARKDVNAVALANKPFEKYVADTVLPYTSYRPSLAIYPQVSVAIQTLAQALATGTPVTSALATYTASVDKLVGATNVTDP